MYRSNKTLFSLSLSGLLPSTNGSVSSSRYDTLRYRTARPPAPHSTAPPPSYYYSVLDVIWNGVLPGRSVYGCGLFQPMGGSSKEIENDNATTPTASNLRSGRQYNAKGRMNNRRLDKLSARLLMSCPAVFVCVRSVCVCVIVCVRELIYS